MLENPPNEPATRGSLFKVLLACALIPIATITVVLTAYIVHFRNGHFSSAEAWGAFGSYFGGTLGPLLAYFALIAVLWTMKNQSEALSLSRETAHRQWEYLERKERKEEWLAIIHHAEKQLYDHLNESVEMLDGRITTRGRALQHVAREMFTSRKIGDRAYADTIFKKHFKSLEVGHFSPTSDLAISLAKYLDHFSDNLTERDPEILSHYLSSYQGWISGLRTVGAISESQFQKKVGKLMQKMFRPSS
jgi:hypothetical protein